MENLFITGTRRTPEVSFSLEGRLELSGRSIPEDASLFYDPIYLWVLEYCSKPASPTVLNICLEYFNSGSAKSILKILREINDLQKNGVPVTFNWYYEDGDDDILERGEYFESILETRFNFVEVDE